MGKCNKLFTKLMLLQVPIYILAQFLGSLVAAGVLQGLTDDAEASLTIPYASATEAFIVELILGFNLMFVATAVSTGSTNVRRQIKPDLKISIQQNLVGNLNHELDLIVKRAAEWRAGWNCRGCHCHPQRPTRRVSTKP